MVKETLKTFGETVGARSFPGATEVKLKDIIGTQIMVNDADFKTMQFGEVAILLFEFASEPGKNYSVLVGGEVVIRKVKDAIAQKLLPLLGMIRHDEVYYDII